LARGLLAIHGVRKGPMAAIGGLAKMTFFRNLGNFFESIGGKRPSFVAFQIETPGGDGGPRRAGPVPMLMTWEGAFGDTGYDTV
jgi:hypothetical protein